MLDVIGAGATASTSIDWHETWKNSPEAAKLEDELQRIHAEGRSRPVVQTEQRAEFATSWTHQAIALTQRNYQAYWRNPTYLMAKLVLNIAGGLLIGFTFYKSKDTLQGSQNKLFVSLLVFDVVRSLTCASHSRSSWPRLCVSPSLNRCKRYISISDQFMKFVSARAGCTSGPLW